MLCLLDIRIERRSDEAHLGCTHRAESRPQFLDSVACSGYIDRRIEPSRDTPGTLESLAERFGRRSASRQGFRRAAIPQNPPGYCRKFLGKHGFCGVRCVKWGKHEIR